MAILVPRMHTVVANAPNFGIVFSTYAAVPYVHLFLESARRHFPHVPVLVVDDCSPDFLHMMEITKRYGAALVSSPHRLGHYRGDVGSFLAGLFWARSRGCDFVVKMSRRFIPLQDWTAGLAGAIAETQYATYCSYCADTHIGFRTECVALHVASWFTDPAVWRLRRGVTDDCGLVEAYLHNIARSIHMHNCEANKEYERLHPRPQPMEAYGDWPLIGTSRVRRMTDVLWHHHSPPEDYLREAESFGLKYQLQDFMNLVAD